MSNEALAWANAFLQVFIRSPWLIFVIPIPFAIAVAMAHEIAQKIRQALDPRYLPERVEPEKAKRDVDDFEPMSERDIPNFSFGRYILSNDGELMEVIDEKPKRGEDYDG